MGQDVSRYKHVSKGEVLEKAKTGDIILVSGGSFFSAIIKCFTLSEWSHIGVVIRDIPIKGKICKGPFILQALITNEGHKDYLEGFKKAPGVQLNSLSKVIDREKGKICWRKFMKWKKPSYIPLYKGNTTFVKKSCKLPYELHLSELLNVISQANEYAGTDSYFCSELVAEFYFVSEQVAIPGKNRKNHPFAKRDKNHFFSNNIKPSQFGEDTDDPFIFENGYTLGECKFIV